MKVIKKREKRNAKNFLFPELNQVPELNQGRRKDFVATKLQEGDELIFEFKETPSREVILIFSAMRKAEKTERVEFGGDDKILLGAFPDIFSAILMVYRISLFLEKVFEREIKEKVFLKEEKKFILVL